MRNGNTNCLANSVTTANKGTKLTELKVLRIHTIMIYKEKNTTLMIYK